MAMMVVMRNGDDSDAIGSGGDNAVAVGVAMMVKVVDDGGDVAGSDDGSKNDMRVAVTEMPVKSAIPEDSRGAAMHQRKVMPYRRRRCRSKCQRGCPDLTSFVDYMRHAVDMPDKGHGY